VVLKQDSPELFLLTRVRDEAHRFAITYHRILRGRRALQGALEQIAGVGKARRKALLEVFGSVKRLGEATVEEIASVGGIGGPLARKIHLALHPSSPGDDRDLPLGNAPEGGPRP
jgi:excinuclease ABC subunit C